MGKTPQPRPTQIPPLNLKEMNRLAGQRDAARRLTKAIELDPNVPMGKNAGAAAARLSAGREALAQRLRNLQVNLARDGASQLHAAGNGVPVPAQAPTPKNPLSSYDAALAERASERRRRAEASRIRSIKGAVANTNANLEKLQDWGYLRDKQAGRLYHDDVPNMLAGKKYMGQGQWGTVSNHKLATENMTEEELAKNTAYRDRLNARREEALRLRRLAAPYRAQRQIGAMNTAVPGAMGQPIGASQPVYGGGMGLAAAVQAGQAREQVDEAIKQKLSIEREKQDMAKQVQSALLKSKQLDNQVKQFEVEQMLNPETDIEDMLRNFKATVGAKEQLKDSKFRTQAIKYLDTLPVDQAERLKRELGILDSDLIDIEREQEPVYKFGETDRAIGDAVLGGLNPLADIIAQASGGSLGNALFGWETEEEARQRRMREEYNSRQIMQKLQP